eukprot:COSAG02_NODE_1112_length_14506_cov_31.458944_1_plen_118_part_00
MCGLLMTAQFRGGGQWRLVAAMLMMLSLLLCASHVAVAPDIAGTTSDGSEMEVDSDDSGPIAPDSDDRPELAFVVDPRAPCPRCQTTYTEQNQENGPHVCITTQLQTTGATYMGRSH